MEDIEAGLRTRRGSASVYFFFLPSSHQSTKKSPTRLDALCGRRFSGPSPLDAPEAYAVERPAGDEKHDAKVSTNLYFAALREEPRRTRVGDALDNHDLTIIGGWFCRRVGIFLDFPAMIGVGQQKRKPSRAQRLDVRNEKKRRLAEDRAMVDHLRQRVRSHSPHHCESAIAVLFGVEHLPVAARLISHLAQQPRIVPPPPPASDSDDEDSESSGAAGLSCFDHVDRRVAFGSRQWFRDEGLLAVAVFLFGHDLPEFGLRFTSETEKLRVELWRALRLQGANRLVASERYYDTVVARFDRYVSPQYFRRPWRARVGRERFAFDLSVPGYLPKDEWIYTYSDDDDEEVSEDCSAEEYRKHVALWDSASLIRLVRSAFERSEQGDRKTRRLKRSLAAAMAVCVDDFVSLIVEYWLPHSDLA